MGKYRQTREGLLLSSHGRCVCRGVKSTYNSPFSTCSPGLHAIPHSILQILPTSLLSPYPKACLWDIANYLHTHTHTRAFWAAPCLLIQLMTILKHMLTIIAPKCFRTNLIFLVFWFRAMLPSVSPLALAENPVNRCSGIIPYPPWAMESRISQTPRIVLCETNVSQPPSGHTLEA